MAKKTFIEADERKVIWIPVKETAAMLSSALKQQFPDTNFSVKVKRNTGYKTIEVQFENGPSLLAVQAIVEQYQKLRANPALNTADPVYVDHNGEQVEAQFYNYTHVHRAYTLDVCQAMVAAICTLYGIERPVVYLSATGSVWLDRFVPLPSEDGRPSGLNRRVVDELSAWSAADGPINGPDDLPSQKALRNDLCLVP